MRKTVLFLLAFICSCSSSPRPADCPDIVIPREMTNQYINNGNYDAFQITLSGNENYCYTDSSTHQRYAVITPIFRLRRLEDSADSAVDTSFYAKTIGSGQYIGKQVYHQPLRIPLGEKEQIITGKPIKLRIAQPPYDNFSIELGLNLSEYASAKSKSMFDINYRYLSEEDLEAQEQPINNEYLEIAPDEKVVYCEKSGKPIIVKKSVVSYPCN